MYDLNLPWGGDLSLSPQGGTELISGSALTQQRIIRRLLTNQGDYIWDPTYGGNLRQYVDEPFDVAAVTAHVQAQTVLESTVQSVLSVVLTFQPSLGIATCTINYTASTATGPQVLTFAP
jgi:phage baseplate assembly protein W